MVQAEGRMSAPQPLQRDAAQLKINFDTRSSPAVASWVNCSNVYSAFQSLGVCSALHTGPATWLLVPETTGSSLTYCSHSSAVDPSNLGRVPMISDPFGVLENIYPTVPVCKYAVTVLLLCEVWEHIPSRRMIRKLAHSAHLICSSCKLPPQCHPL